jgi:RHS repeat-associated protein
MPIVNYDWDELEDNIVEEFDDAGNTLAEYTTEPDLFGNVISQNREGVESQFHFDALGSTLAIADEDENVTDTFAYTAFGEVAERAGTSAVSFQYIGRRGYYALSSLTYRVRRRHFLPHISRWQSIDPFTLAVNRQYTYCDNRPCISIDPSGLVAVADYYYAACCEHCQTCENTMLTRICHGIFWVPPPYEVCRDPQTKACPLPLGPDGKPIIHAGRVYTTPRQCCESLAPTNYWPHKCTQFESKTFDEGSCSSTPWPARCDQMMVDWISKANTGPGSEGHALCITWCNTCIVPPDVDIVTSGIIKRLCLDRICAPAFPDDPDAAPGQL